MITSDKIEIASLISNIEEMRDLSSKLDKPYHDRRIAEYAKAAFDDANETAEYIKGVVNSNLELFFDINHINLSTHPCSGDYWADLRDGKPISFHFGKFMTIVFNVDNAKVHKFLVGTYKASFALTDKRGMEATFVRPYTSDTNSKLYHFCAWDDLFYSSYGKLKYDLRSNHTPAVWSDIKRRADSTREQTRILLEDFKDVLRGLAANHKVKADKAEATRAENRKTGAYVCVGV